MGYGAKPRLCSRIYHKRELRQPAGQRMLAGPFLSLNFCEHCASSNSIRLKSYRQEVVRHLQAVAASGGGPAPIVYVGGQDASIRAIQACTSPRAGRSTQPCAPSASCSAATASLTDASQVAVACSSQGHCGAITALVCCEGGLLASASCDSMVSTGPCV